jgi:hypothetical protein
MMHCFQFAFPLNVCISYPSGQLAISIITVGLGLFTYVVQDDSTDGNVMAVFLPSGQGVVYHSNGQPR